MASANNTFNIIGNLTKKPEVKTTKNNKAYSFVTVAVNGAKEKPDYISVVLWEKLAETVAKYCDKGDCIAVNGHITTGIKDNNTVLQLTASDVKFIYKAKGKAEKRPDPEYKPETETFEAPNNTTDIFAPF